MDDAEKDWEMITDDWASTTGQGDPGRLVSGNACGALWKNRHLADFVRKAHLMNYEAYPPLEGRNAQMFHPRLLYHG